VQAVLSFQVGSKTALTDQLSSLQAEAFGQKPSGSSLRVFETIVGLWLGRSVSGILAFALIGQGGRNRRYANSSVPAGEVAFRRTLALNRSRGLHVSSWSVS
jgi:hypothetical protein